MSVDRRRLRELALVFLKLGAMSFGGPAAHVAMMEEEIVRRRAWMTGEEFLDLLGATNLIPGPNSTEMAIHVGRVRAGWPGLLVAGVCFIAPAATLVLACAWAYVRFGTRPAAAALLYGMKPAVLAVVVAALVSLGRTALRTPPAIATAAAATVMVVAGVHELVVLLLFAGVALAAGVGAAAGRGAAVGKRALALIVSPVAAGAAPAVGLLPLFLVFAKIGAVLYGSGYVLFAFLRADLVERYRWLTEAQLLDAIAIGQITPGPLFTTATFVGYVLAGVPGAAVATIGIFLPAFVFVAATGPLIPRLRKSRGAAAFLDGVNAASLALMAVVTVQLAGDALVDAPAVSIGVAAGVVLALTRCNSVWLLLGGALVGLTRLFR